MIEPSACTIDHTRYRGVSRLNSGFLSRGFTLIELMVVLVILAFFSGMVVLSIGDSFARELRSEAERFHIVVQAASDEAVYSSSDIGVLMTDTGYTLMRVGPIAREWQGYTSGAFVEHSLDSLIRIRWTIEGFSRVAPDDDSPGFLDREGDDQHFSDSLVTDADAKTPQVLLLASGEVTAFAVDFFAADETAGSLVYRVESDGFSLPTIKKLETAR